MDRRRSARLALVVLPVLIPLLVVVAYVGGQSGAETILEQGLASRRPCPDMPTRVRPSEINLAPGLIQHQSWIEFPVPTRFAGFYAFCLDNKLLELGGGHLDERSGIWRFHLATRSIDLYWLSGGLDALREPNRWELGLACAVNYVCQ